MPMPALDDTIIAVSSGWRADPLGIIRVSGPGAFELLQQVGVTLPAADTRPTPGWCEARLAAGDDFSLPATVFWFRTPRSYTGQDVVEIHTVGSLPALRALSARLIELGARRALPGEFTARAFLNGKLDADQVEGVLALINAEDQAAARQAARLSREPYRARLGAINDRLTELIALVEAGIDFVEEEDVRFITPAELSRSLEELADAISAIAGPGRALHQAVKPHVALAGLPNAGKSTLFNALLGYERAIVAPVLGTTRDVLSAEVEAGGVSVVLQDCAGLGASADELESAAHLAAEQAADHADLVLWVHDCTVDWDAREAAVCRRIPAIRRVLVVSKLDRWVGDGDRPPPIAFSTSVKVSAVTGAGLRRMREVLAECLESLGSRQGGGLPAEHLGTVSEALARARAVAVELDEVLAMPEVVALELRHAWEALESIDRGPLAEDILGRILARFCIGK
ncbi:MAG: tRNA modification GTPase [Phycisphaerae bacterium]